MVGDQTPAVLGFHVAAGDRSTIMLGANDERHYAVDSTKQSYYRDGLRNLIGWLALASKQTARSVGGETGAWSNTQIQGIGHATSTLGASKTFTVSGTTVYAAVTLADSAGNNAPYSISIDGVVQGNYASSAPGMISIGAPTPYAYADRLHRFAGLAAGNHTITVTQTGAGNLAVEWAAGNAQTAFPRVFVGNIIRQADASGSGYSKWGGSDANVASYNADVAQIVSDFRSDGLAVTLVDVHSALNNTTDLSRDGLHPVQSGQDKIAEAFLSAITAGTTVANAPIYQRLINSRAEAPIKAPVKLTAARCASN
jgi:lysophospholipase L1-like esterase